MISLLLLIIPSLIIGIVGYNSAKESLNESGKTTLKNGVKMAIQMIDALDKEVKKGNISLEEAQERVKVYLLGELQEDGKRPINSPVDLGKHGYFIVYDETGLEVAHPTIEGKNVWDVQDIDGNYLVQDQISVAKSGGGFTYYKWALPNDPDTVASKITYNELDPNWGWIVAAGSYMMDFNSEANQLLYVLLITLAIALLVGVILIVLFSNHLAKPIKRVSQRVGEVAEGNLSSEKLTVKNNDEIGMLAEHVNHMTDNLRHMIGQVSEASEQVAATSEELTASAEETSKATETITGSIQEVATGTDKQVESANSSNKIVADISRGMERIGFNVQSVNDSALETARTAETGTAVISRTINQINLINDKTLAIQSIVDQLGGKSNEIGKIVSMITDVAEQTNLLALNAAIEAARAGEHGKGFAVVADEVRKLAEQSGHAAGQISQLIQDIRNDINHSVSSMGEGRAAVQEGITLVNLAGESFESITNAINHVSEQIHEVSAAVQQASSGTQSMVAAIDETTKISGESAGYIQTVAASAEEQNASMQEISTAADNLSKMAEELQGAVRSFKL
jgi:methyl-accepting chemotaxis protein